MATVPTATGGANIRTTRKRPADYTGQLKEAQEAQHLDELENRQAEIGLANAVKAAANQSEIDYTGHQVHEAELVAQAVEVLSPEVSIRVNYPIEDMTFGREVYPVGDPQHPLGESATEPYVGALRTYTFEEGRSYRVSRDLAEHLDKKGYLWHITGGGGKLG